MAIAERAAVERQQPRVHGRQDHVGRRRDCRPHELDFHACRHDGDEIQDLPHVDGQRGPPRENRFAHTDRDGVAAAAQHFCDEERIASRQRKHRLRIVSGSRHPADGVERQRLNADAVGRAGGQFAEDAVERMIGTTSSARQVTTISALNRCVRRLR